VPNSQGMCTSFKGELLQGTHNFGGTAAPVRATNAADVFKAALYLASATVNSGTAAYTATGEVGGTNYAAGGVSVTNGTNPTTAGTTAYWTPSASILYSNVTLATSFDAVLIYNSTQGNRAVSVHTFTAQTIVAGTFAITMPANAAGTALLNIA
jgi:hypothetical protein